MLETHPSHKGSLTTVALSSLDFQPRGMFYITDVPRGGIRGQHAHRTATQLLVCMQGNILISNTHTNKHVARHDLFGGDYLIIEPMVWSSQQYRKENSVLLVLTSHIYNEQDYIRDYQEWFQGLGL